MAVWVLDEGFEALPDLVRAREAAKQDQMRARQSVEQVSAALRAASTVRSETLDACYLIWVADGSGCHASGLSARSRAHAATCSASGASINVLGKWPINRLIGHSHEGTPRYHSDPECRQTGSNRAVAN
jgi:hypothetical protein